VWAPGIFECSAGVVLIATSFCEFGFFTGHVFQELTAYKVCVRLFVGASNNARALYVIEFSLSKTTPSSKGVETTPPPHLNLKELCE
jgi:hypothetical protein